MGNVTLRSYQHFIKPRSRLALNAAIPILLAIATFLAYPSAAHAQLKVIISGGFSTAYRQVLPEFEGSTGITVTTLSGASQGKGPETIAAQLSRGVAADVAILSREGLSELIAAGGSPPEPTSTSRERPSARPCARGRASRTSAASRPSSRRC